MNDDGNVFQRQAMLCYAERMSDSWDRQLGRRALLGGAAATAGLCIARGLGAHRWPDAAGGASYESTLVELGRSLTAKQRELVVFPSDHPTRQIVNSQTVIERPHLGTLFSPSQRTIIERLYRNLLSPRGVDHFAGTVAVEGRFDGCVLAIYGEPTNGRAHSVLQGGHLMLRGGTDANSAFGGGISYGHQTGNGLWRVPGNSFAYHSDAANRLFTWISADDRRRAIQAQPPHELVLQVQDERGPFPGVHIGSLGEPARDEAQLLLEAIFSSYPEAQRNEAWASINAHGGVAGLYFSVYATHGFYDDMTTWASLDAAGRARRGDPYWQVWRLEGPGTIIHFKGYPHVHAYIQIVRDPAQANVGSTLAVTDSAVEGDAMRGLLEAALRRASGEGLAFYGKQVPGRFCPGTITSGLAYALDPYRNRVAVATLRGRAMSPALRDDLKRRGTAVHDDASYRVASTNYVVEESHELGDAERVEVSRVLVRDALVDLLRADGLNALRV